MVVQRHTPPPAVAAEHLCAWSGASAAAAARQSAPPATLAPPPPHPAQLRESQLLIRGHKANSVRPYLKYTETIYLTIY